MLLRSLSTVYLHPPDLCIAHIHHRLKREQKVKPTNANKQQATAL